MADPPPWAEPEPIVAAAGGAVRGAGYLAAAACTAAAAVALATAGCGAGERLSVEVPGPSASVASHVAPTGAVEAAVAPARVGDVGPPGRWGEPIEGATPQQLAALEWVNWYRAQAGLSPVVLDEALDAAAAAHASYVAAHASLYDHGLSLHEEIEGLEGFTGTHFFDRLAAAGAAWSPLGEVVAWQPVAAAAVRQWVESVYHRLPLLAPGAGAIGYGLAAKDGRHVAVLEVGRAPALPAGPPIVWPPDGATDVPLAWDGKEVPQPMAPPQGFPSGPVLSVTVPGAIQLVVDEAALLEDQAHPLPHIVLTPAVDPLLDGTGTVALYAAAPLRPGRTYGVVVRGRADGDPFEARWSFTTKESDDCDVLAQDCGPGQACYPIAGHPVCAWVGAAPEGAPCTYQNDCMAGTTCVLGQCRRVCGTAAADAAAACAAVCAGGFAMLADADGLGVCDPPACTPMADTCAGPAVCVFDPRPRCEAPGTQPVGATCETSAACGPGSACLSTGAGEPTRCLTLCDASPLAGEPTHPLGVARALAPCATTCPDSAFSTPTLVGLGVCGPPSP